MSLKGEPYDFEREYFVTSRLMEYEGTIRGTKTDKDWPQKDLIESYRKDAGHWVESMYYGRFGRFPQYATAEISILKTARRNLAKAANNLPLNLDPLFEMHKEFLEDAIQAIDDELESRGIGQLPSDAIREETRKTLATLKSLASDCEEEVRNDPGQEALIRRIYRQATDKIREQQ